MKAPDARTNRRRLLLVPLLLGGVAVASEPPEPPDAPGTLAWPRVHVQDGHVLTMWQPQIDRWDDFESMSATAVVAVRLDGADAPEFGSIRLSAATLLDPENRSVRLGRRRLAGTLFPDTEAAQYAQVRAELDALLPNEAIELSLDDILPYLDVARYATRAVDVGMDPPPIFVSDVPAILVIFMGAPSFEPIVGTELSFAVNTNWDVLRHEPTSRCYLLHEDGWITTTDVEHGPWEPAAALPAGLGDLAGDPNWEAVSEHLPGTPLTSAPRVVVSLVPAELVVTDGAPRLVAIDGTPLLEVANTDRDLFVDTEDGRYYLLLAGRWFRASSLDDPWSAATTDLPGAFARIPPDHARADVLASVPGTAEAREAVLLASIPRTTTILRNDATVDVAYDGAPAFGAIAGAVNVQAAENTPYDVFLVNGRYYCCDEGVWFTSVAPDGPWLLCDRVPDEIYTIPATSPYHNVTYVEVSDADDATVEFSQTSGYTGAYVTAGLLVFGLGYAISQADDVSVRVRVRLGSHYYSYGSGARYDHYRGGYYRSARHHGPYGGAGRWASYDPLRGRYTRGAYRYGPRGSAAAVAAYDPYRERFAGRTGAVTRYGSWGRAVVATDDGWARSGHRSGRRGTVGAIETSDGAAVVGVEGRRGERGFIARNDDGDLYAGSNGRVYRRDDDGQWQERDGRRWKTISDSAKAGAGHTRRAELDRQNTARRRGAIRSRGFGRPGGGRRGGR